MYIVSFTDNSGKVHEHEHEYESTAKLFIEHMKEFYPNSNPVLKIKN
jgi:hypothetical protein